MTKTPWKQYLLLQVPLAALALALVAQGLAFGLSGVSILRGRPDQLALATLKDPAQYRILLFGDSVTGLSTVRFSLGAPGEVANLTTDQKIGLTGSLFLLQRYLSTHASPEHVVVALVPVLYRRDNDPRDARYHLWHTFNRPDERDFLRAYIPGIDQRDWLPAILDVQERIMEPFLSLFFQQRAARIEAGSLTANADAPVEWAKRADAAENQASADKRDFTMTAMNAEVIRRMCRLGKDHGFRIDFVWPPMPARLEMELMSSGALAELEAGVRSITQGRCDFGGFTNFNGIRTYPDLAFHNDLTHLFGDGWQQRYTADMREYLNDLLRPVPAPLPPAVGAIEASGVGRSLPDRPEVRPDEPAR